MTKNVVDIENAELVPRDDYVAVLEAIIAEGNCPFCEQQLLRFHTKPIISRSEHWIVTSNAWPYAGTREHFLFISLAHAERIEELSDAARLDFFAEYDRLVQNYKIQGATLVWRSGDTSYTGASVRHLHAQLIVGNPRIEGCEAITALVGFRPTE